MLQSVLCLSSPDNTSPGNVSLIMAKVGGSSALQQLQEPGPQPNGGVWTFLELQTIGDELIYLLYVYCFNLPVLKILLFNVELVGQLFKCKVLKFFFSHLSLEMMPVFDFG
jgi:hypothetical protein